MGVNLHTQRHLRWYTTPQELRALADRMEQQWEESLIGDSAVVKQYFAVPDVTFSVVIDQGKMRRNGTPVEHNFASD